MKLLKIKLLTAINGLLTVSSLIMLFFGLCNQVNESSNFLADEQTIANNANLIICMAVIAMMIFGFAFFASWIKTRKVEAHLLRHRTHRA
ncbi:hypothetical protein PT287_04975 [Lactobacillus sp. ESL0679]|uniref:hypothetical protein n=1 Tax=unclassified Lactobacillus TaxID=2620435 RepID=UPI0023F91020|nr:MULTISPECIES: hypothetical protein [unclassified Lactobacillus]MDF7682877.1 hypothetical protein [Lactobacillus sp. ESL0679]WEV37131.1 hypothetical protein OZX76_00670 [Lactobacillus sp. ESL0677]WEV51270.1 hypothetical protein OZX63_00660 [Lactobacillus sp. ESL0700]WEV62400.1 hypothetical protein OZX69_00660 [Lactobacillus sp. ESL0731]